MTTSLTSDCLILPGPPDVTDENRRNDEADTDEILGSQENRPVDGAHSDKHFTHCSAFYWKIKE